MILNNTSVFFIDFLIASESTRFDYKQHFCIFNRFFERIRKNFVRLSNELGLYELEDGRKRPIYVYRHSFITGRRKKGVDTNVLALHSNNSPQMINQHYSVLSDDHLLEIHNQIFPERRKSTQKLKVITKK